MGLSTYGETVETTGPVSGGHTVILVDSAEEGQLCVALQWTAGTLLWSRSPTYKHHCPRPIFPRSLLNHSHLGVCLPSTERIAGRTFWEQLSDF